jgi:hypothetical protein
MASVCCSTRVAATNNNQHSVRFWCSQVRARCVSFAVVYLGCVFVHAAPHRNVVKNYYCKIKHVSIAFVVSFVIEIVANLDPVWYHVVVSRLRKNKH